MAQIRPVSEELQKVANEQCFEVPERIVADLEALKIWIKQQPHLRSRTDDQFLVAFLRGCKYSLEKAKAKIDKYYTLRTKFPNSLRTVDVDDNKFRALLKLGVITFLPTPLHGNGPRIVLMRSGVYSPSDHSMDTISRVIHAMQDILLIEDDYAIINGIVFIIDMEKATAAHIFQMTPKEMKRMTVYSEQALPLRPKASHFVHTPAGFETLFNMMKPMLSEKQQKRLFVHGNKIELLHEQIPKQYLPKEYGGNNGAMADVIAHWERKFDEYRDYFRDEANYGTDEKLRPGKPIDFDGIFGSEGSFRKLEVD